MKKRMAVLGILLVLQAVLASAQVQVVKRGTEKVSLSLTDLKAAGGGAALLFRRTIEDDLKRSGYFTLVEGAASITVGGNCGEAGGSVLAACRVQNRATGKQYFDKTYRDASAQARRLAHVAADEIIFAVTGIKGISGTRIAMIGLRGGRKDLYACDADGGNVTQITREGVPCLSPAWSRDGKSLFYTSFVSTFPDVYRIDLASNRRTRTSGFPGLNMCGAVSPDGGRIALILSKDGNPDLYIMSLGSGQLTRVTRTRQAAEASPSWSPDGSQIVYVSDRAGSPQLYVISAAGGGERRITLRGSQNVGPDWGSDGRIVYGSLRGGCFQICLADAGGEREQLTTDSADHQDPSWAPDGRHVVYARSTNYRSTLYVLDTQERTEVGLTAMEGSWYSPAWSPR